MISIVIATGELSLEGEDGEKKKRQTRGGKANKIVTKQKAAEKKVILSLETRSKKKSVTIVKGLSTFDIDPKKAAKMMSNKFACGASVQAGDEIVIQVLLLLLHGVPQGSVLGPISFLRGYLYGPGWPGTPGCPTHPR